ncbi:hypothetical protein Tco_1065946, partial [Tanacetum coccineum]
HLTRRPQLACEAQDGKEIARESGVPMMARRRSSLNEKISQEVLHRVCRWWDMDFQHWSSFSEWEVWFSAIRLPVIVKSLMEGVFYVAWWFVWGFRNRSIFDDNTPSRSKLFEDIVSSSFIWCNSRSSRKFSRDAWLKNPHLISL